MMKICNPNIYLLLILELVLITYASGLTPIVNAVLGGEARLPCPAEFKDLNEVLHFVWRKSSTPSDTSYWYGVETDEHKSYLLNSHFLPFEKPPILIIKNLNLKDQGGYLCVIIFKKKSEATLPVDLRVIIPPEKIEISRSNGSILKKWTGHHREFSDVTLLCRVTGGTPVPMISWFNGSHHLNGTSESSTDAVMESYLTMKNISRKDYRRNITCEGSNTDLITPIISSVLLNVHYNPSKVEIVKEDLASLIAGKEHEIICIASDGRPAPQVTWFLDSRNLPTKDVKDVISSEDGTRSTLTFTPTIKEEGKILTCSANSHSFPHEKIEDKLILSINYKPKVRLINITSHNVNENDVSRMRCVVDARPPKVNITWYHKKNPLQNDIDKGIMINEEVLLLDPVTYKMKGMYSCVASNEVGIGSSNTFYLNVQHAPVCGFNGVEVVGVGRKEEVDVRCRVEASPTVESFRWEFKNKKGSKDVAQGNFSSEERLSILKYKPKIEDDFGLLYCWSTNSMGEQRKPCKFSVIEAGLPGRLENCTKVNATYSDIFVTCSPGHNGGLKQQFIIEVFDLLKMKHVMNYTSREPKFVLVNLTSDTKFLLSIYASNKMGQSEHSPLKVTTARLNYAGTTPDIIVPVTTLIGVLIGVVSALVFVSIVIVIVMKLRFTNGEKDHDSSAADAPLRASEGENETTETPNDPERHVGSYPKKLRHANLYETTGYEAAPTREDKSTQHCCTFA